MVEFKNILKACKKFGYQEADDICEFWFANQKKLQEYYYGPKTHSTTIPSQIRWKSEFGQLYQKAIRDYIENKVKKNWDLINDNAKRGNYVITYAIIDFKDFIFKYNGDNHHPDKLPNKYFTKQLFGTFDLSGIDLCSIRINHCIVRNCTMTDSNFGNSYFWNVILDNCCFNCSSFKYASLMQIELTKGTRIISIDLLNAKVESLQYLSDKSVFLPLKYNEVSYLWLIKESFNKIFSKNRFYSPAYNKRHTDFQSNDISQLTTLQLKPLREYINWYQLVSLKLNLLHELSLRQKILFLLQLVSTKFWSSYTVLAGFSFLINFLFAIIIYFNHTSFNHLNKNFVQSFYYTVVTFTTLGYGDISPINSFGQILVMCIAISGYIILGLFVFLVSRKIDKSF